MLLGSEEEILIFSLNLFKCFWSDAANNTAGSGKSFLFHIPRDRQLSLEQEKNCNTFFFTIMLVSWFAHPLVDCDRRISGHSICICWRYNAHAFLIDVSRFPPPFHFSLHHWSGCALRAVGLQQQIE